MAQYLMSVLVDSPELATPAETTAVTAFDEGLRAGGHWVLAGGLAAPETATVVDGRGGREAVLADGPYLETKEFVTGFWIVEAPGPEAAARLAAGGSRACNRRIELRPFL